MALEFMPAWMDPWVEAGRLTGPGRVGLSRKSLPRHANDWAVRSVWMSTQLRWSISSPVHRGCSLRGDFAPWQLLQLVNFPEWGEGDWEKRRGNSK